ncbi:MAG TPA: hypothetical protein VGE12_21920 [Noviherbaspirillum sp.]
MRFRRSLRYLSAGIALLLLQLHAGAAPAGNGKFTLHVQVLKDNVVVEDVTVDAAQGETAGACFGTRLDPATLPQGQRRVECDGLRVAFTPREAEPQALQASFAVEYFKPVAATGAPARYDGFSTGATMRMTLGTPVVTAHVPYTLRVDARN